MYGFGERKTPKSFVAACDKFIYVENLTYASSDAVPAGAAALKPAPRASAAKLKSDTALVNQLRNAVEAASDDEGWAALAAVGNIITKQAPDFDSRTYGYGKLSDLIAATTLFELDSRSPGDGKPGVMYARDKRRHPGKKPRPIPADRHGSMTADDDSAIIAGDESLRTVRATPGA